MEKKYWLRRQHVAGAMARSASSSRARLIHLELAGRYGILAHRQSPFLLESTSSSEGEEAALDLPTGIAHRADALHYEKLQIGALYLAGRAEDAGERSEHLRMASLYAERASEAAPRSVD